ncbi:carbohydrate ABC transporter permease [Brevibacillus formosus]|uniref:carbohydrate ABC transporter permease n=1 Tax=Brevibacillus TaxID=55080 RepID=UPI000D0F2E2D|nr:MULTISPECIES: carbohydrate ABC transporter permease [Brevibacillus]MBG9941840.1 sugar ABC transporter ATP-binding protein [Brevibacillus formosus]MED1945544.1 carbohydrate ABC transporter permease [Brevibacillus formosus]MED2000823.1 carbohydrate ABC transporter permease [Brevibacillus formosus]MED2084331.1 carbohydrate ABC transporter permease [Brevibacillus formosus]PSK09706.1 sugar ABC transporter ATP-binding protein [Brevibacillus sp. NRRL NRS-603]
MKSNRHGLHAGKLLGIGGHYVVLSAISLLMLVPFLWMLSTSLKEPAKIFVFPPEFIPSSIRLENYTEVLANTPFHLFYWNSLYIAILVTVGTVLFASIAGYAFARIPFRGRNIVFLVLLSTMMIPHEVTSIPMFLFMRMLGFINTHVPLIVLPIFGAGGIFGVFVMRQFFLGIPKELEEAAMIDGCSRWRIYWSIMLPLAKPAIATLTIFTFLTSWNEFYDPLIFINDRELMTLPLALSLFTDEVGTAWHHLMSASVMATLPLLIVFFFAQKQFIEGVSMTGLKD